MSVKRVFFVCGQGIKDNLDINHEIVVIIAPLFPFGAQVQKESCFGNHSNIISELQTGTEARRDNILKRCYPPFPHLFYTD